MILYSVTVNIDDDVHNDWLEYMRGRHIPDVMATGLFQGHRMFRILTRFEEETGTTYNIQYYLDSMAEYERYQREFAPAFQKEHTERYAGKFAAFRTVLQEV